jgi:cytochrome oxidase Cu insertion factor (SCO1/SenC/PrrC family)
MTMADSGRSERSRGRRQLVLLALLFALPVLLAFALYFGGWRSEGTTNRGVLVTPARVLQDAALVTLDGTPARFSGLAGKWLMVYIGLGGCDTVCERNLYTMRQVHAAQGKQAGRVQRVLLVTELGAHDSLDSTLKAYPGMIVLAGPPEAARALAAQFRVDTESPGTAAGRIYLVDPLGNFMMYYEADADPQGLRKDLARLLRLSHIG